MDTMTKRPTGYSKEVIAEAVDAILDDVMQWLGDEGDRDEARADLIKCATYDAYDFARALDDRCHWSADAELVDVLGGYSTWGAQRNASKKWVAETGFKVPFAIGETVFWRGDEYKVVRIEHDLGQIIAQPVVSDGKNYGADGGYVINAEEAKAVQQ